MGLVLESEVREVGPVLESEVLEAGYCNGE